MKLYPLRGGETEILFLIFLPTFVNSGPDIPKNTLSERSEKNWRRCHHFTDSLSFKKKNCFFSLYVGQITKINSDSEYLDQELSFAHTFEYRGLVLPYQNIETKFPLLTINEILNKTNI